MSRTVIATGADGTLFDVALRELTDPLDWWQIAQASGVTDPWLGQAVVTLTVPTVTAPNGDGLPNP